MSEMPAVFGFPELWGKSYSDHEHLYQVIARSSDVAAEIITSTATDNGEAVTALGSLASVNLGSMQDVVILIGNRRGAGAMKLARSMVEVAITALYLERNPAEVGMFLDFAHVFSWNYLQQSENDNPGSVAPQLRAQGEIEYNRVKSRFANPKGKVRNTWSTKNIREMAEEVGYLEHYKTAYRLGSDLLHAGIAGLISHEFDWDLEALVIGDGSMLQAASSLFNASKLVPAELGRKLEARSKEGNEVRKRYVENRDKDRSGRSPAE
jgi:hypothetical protein